MDQIDGCLGSYVFSNVKLNEMDELDKNDTVMRYWCDWCDLWWVHVFMLMWWYQWAHSMDWFKRKIRGKREFWPKMIGVSRISSQIFVWSNSGAHVVPTLIDLVFLSATTYCWIPNHPSKTVCRKKHNYLDGNIPQFFPVSLKQCRLFFSCNNQVPISYHGGVQKSSPNGDLNDLAYCIDYPILR